MPAEPARKKPPLPPGAERRQFERFELLAQVQLRREGEILLLPVVNVSAGGLLVRVEHGEVTNVTMGEELHVFLEEPVELAMDACVVRILGPAGAPTGIAIMWTSTDGESVSRLARLLDHLRAAGQ